MARVARDGPMPYLESEVAGTKETKANHIVNTDALVIGGGLSGITAIHRLRKAGLEVKCFEAGLGFGGVW